MGFILGSLMLTQEVKEILNDFDNASPNRIVEILTRIRHHLKSDITQNYLQEKIQGILNVNNVAEKRKLCENLKPYLDWYLQGNS